jgi:putative transposase
MKAKYKVDPEKCDPKVGYASDLTDEQWVAIEHIFVSKNNTGKHLQNTEKHDLVNAVLYTSKTGCQWRMLPNDFPKHQTVASFYYRAIQRGLWEKVLGILVKKSREQAGCKPEPTYALIDSQSVKTTGNADSRGFDGNKKSRGASDI